ncbi:pyridoxal phosphate biosynthetic protein [Bordetella pertussis]|nr:pyridoxal phosphate biosynthetic protein [Bordetella pertussis]
MRQRRAGLDHFDAAGLVGGLGRRRDDAYPRRIAPHGLRAGARRLDRRYRHRAAEQGRHAHGRPQMAGPYRTAGARVRRQDLLAGAVGRRPVYLPRHHPCVAAPGHRGCESAAHARGAAPGRLVRARAGPRRPSGGGRGPEPACRRERHLRHRGRRDPGAGGDAGQQCRGHPGGRPDSGRRAVSAGRARQVEIRHRLLPRPGLCAVQVGLWRRRRQHHGGLPVVRVSVDHGTAFDIAGKGIARGQPGAGRGRPWAPWWPKG